MGKVRAGIVASVLVAFVLGALLGYLVQRASSGRSSSGCEASGQEAHPSEDRCVQLAEVCTAWVRGTANQTEGCVATSADGKALLRVQLEGSGSVRVLVRDANDRALYDTTHTFPGAVEVGLEGSAGPWSLLASFRDANGYAKVTLWG